MAVEGLIYWGSVSAATDQTMNTIVTTGGTATRSSIVALIQQLVPGIIAQDPAVIAAATAAVAQALQDASIVTGSTISDRAALLSWGTQDVVAWDVARDTVPARTTVARSASFVILDENGHINPSVLPPSDDGNSLADELAIVSERGRPSYAPSHGDYDPLRQAYNFDPGQFVSWRAARELARRGIGNAIALSIGSSIDQIVGGILAGETWPADAWPGQAIARSGLPIGGTGLRHVSLGLPITPHVGGFAEPTITIANPDTATSKIERLALGFAQSSFVKITDTGAKTAYVEFNTAAGVYTDLWLYGGDIAGTSVVTIDGVDRTWAGSTAVSGADIPALAGYMAGQRISRVVLPSGTHTVRVHGTAAGVSFGGFEGRNNSGVVLHRGAIAGRSLLGFSIVTGALDGLNWAVDPWRAHLLLDGNIVNDWQSHYDVATFKAQRMALWSRAKAGGASVLALITPDPDLNNYPPSGGNNPPLTDYKRATYEAALEADVTVLDLSHRWRNFQTSQAMYTAPDGIHPRGVGLSDIAVAVNSLLLA